VEVTTPVATTNKVFGLPRNIFLLGLTSLFNDFSSEMVFSIFPAFFTAVLKAGAQSLGLVDGIAEAASNFFKIYSGNISDRYQKRKPLIVAGYALSVLTRPCYVLFPSVAGVLGLRFLDRVGKGLRDSPRDAIISLSADRAALGMSFGYHRAMDTTGAILGPLAAYLLLRFFPLRFNLVFATAFIVGILAIFSLYFISDLTARVVANRLSLSASFMALPARFKIFLLSIFLLSTGSLPVVVLLLKSSALHLTIADIPLIYMIYNLAYAVFSIPAGRVSDRLGAWMVIPVGYATLLIAYLALDLANGAWTLAGGFFLLGLFPALTDGVQRSLASQITGEEIRGVALGSLNAATGFGALLAGIGGGYLWQASGPSTTFLVASGLAVVGLLLFSYSKNAQAAKS
jgi:MFS family permease